MAATDRFIVPVLVACHRGEDLVAARREVLAVEADDVDLPLLADLGDPSEQRGLADPAWAVEVDHRDRWFVAVER